MCQSLFTFYTMFSNNQDLTCSLRIHSIIIIFLLACGSKSEFTDRCFFSSGDKFWWHICFFFCFFLLSHRVLPRSFVRRRHMGIGDSCWVVVVVVVVVCVAGAAGCSSPGVSAMFRAGWNLAEIWSTSPPSPGVVLLDISSQWEIMPNREQL